MQTEKHWIVTADNRGATLFECTRTPRGSLHLEAVRTVGKVEHHSDQELATVAGGGKSASIGSPSREHAKAVEDSGHKIDESHHQVVRTISKWLGEAERELKLTSIDLFVPIRLLGLFREALGTSDKKVLLHEGELTHLHAGELAKHPAVTGLHGVKGLTNGDFAA